MEIFAIIEEEKSLTELETCLLLAPTTADVERDGTFRRLLATGRNTLLTNILDFYLNFSASNENLATKFNEIHTDNGFARECQ